MIFAFDEEAELSPAALRQINRYTAQLAEQIARLEKESK